MSAGHRGIGMTSLRTRERLITRLQEQGIRNTFVLDVMRHTPRHLFVDEALASRAYEDTALPIGHSQTLSQPYVVARMTEALLDGGPLRKVLEIGTGSGYQTAVLSQLVDTVYSVERIEPLLRAARGRLTDLRLRNVVFKHSDGGWGWPEHGPYDGVLAAAAGAQVPQSLLNQLAVGGRLVMPVGPRGAQDLVLMVRTNTGFDQTVLNRVSFVPLLGGVE